MSTISINAEAHRALKVAEIAHRKPMGKGGTGLLASLWGFGGRKMLSGLLVLAGTAGIGYGVFGLVDLVQSCALFTAALGRVIQ